MSVNGKLVKEEEADYIQKALVRFQLTLQTRALEGLAALENDTAKELFKKDWHKIPTFP